MSEAKAETIKIELPEGTIEAKGSEQFLAKVRAALASVLTGQAVAISPSQAPNLQQIITGSSPQPARVPTIRDLYEEKRPSSDIQTAALIAYFLSEVAPPGERSSTIDKETMVRYFKLCPRNLPVGDPGQVLRNAKRDGYLDSTQESGQYKLSAIGYNLVVHGLPGGPGGSDTSAAKPRKNKPSGRRGSRATSPRSG